MRSIRFDPLGENLFVIFRDTEIVAHYFLNEACNLNTLTLMEIFDFKDVILSGKNNYSKVYGIYIDINENIFFLWNRTEIFKFQTSRDFPISSANLVDYFYAGEIVSRGHDIYFHPKGRYWYVEDRFEYKVLQFKMPEKYLISESTIFQEFDLFDLGEGVRGIQFNIDESEMILFKTDLKVLNIFKLDNPWKISSAFILIQ